MKFLIFISLFFFLNSCSKPKSVLICGDHICINNAEAEQYFEENLSIEVKIIDKNIKKEIDLVQLNLNNTEGNREVTVTPKSKIDKKLKVLSNKEVSRIKKDIKKKKGYNKIVKKPSSKDSSQLNKNSAKIKITNVNKDVENQRNTNNYKKNIVDICTILEKCSIDEISKYLLEKGNKKAFPDITIRQ